ncbi:nitrous oxide reductase accessory protein NosL [Aneurinibacillus thermoaerophilus]|uniref:nitrous oxide reductase accessory protein NosL n=1 Tax=Aneurinibacillus thermoaerophilus TaxID=143495 RepID=UPI002E1A1E08|nr:nitrous oxide reductase accessory protein NosL [Aneurinibacillus thermoaerophilus]MED0762825.1 nitrous oxide reductase accessory protein NosL [Aneurinibacillus thermoaerophilus]
MKKKGLIMASVLSIALLSGCGTKEYHPVSIEENVDKCSVCNMQVADNQHSTEIILKDGKALKFDDIGCLNEWEKKNGTEQVGAEYVRDYNTKEWVPLKEASFIYDKTFKTPMGYGIYSFKDKGAAQTFLNEQGKGKLMNANDLHSHTWERNMDMMHKMKHGHSDSMKMDKKGADS